LDGIVTRRVVPMRIGQIRYALITNDDGGILDDVLVYRLRDEGGQPCYQAVVNASNRQKIWDWLEEHRDDREVDFIDSTLVTAMIAVQGPRALEIVRPLSTIDPARLRYYTSSETEFFGTPGIISRTGYTGEDGCELIVPASAALELWEKLFAAAQPSGGAAAGLGCRDTLRLEAGMPLYGHELNEDINPFQAGLGYAVDLENRSFPGRDALLKLRDKKNLPCRAGWELAGKRVPREGYAILSAGEPVGRVTSGTFSPTLGKPIAMGYIRDDLSAPGTEVTINIRSHHEPARCVPLPFYRRTS
jgi:aminomethyltransferase